MSQTSHLFRPQRVWSPLATSLGLLLLLLLLLPHPSEGRSLRRPRESGEEGSSGSGEAVVDQDALKMKETLMSVLDCAEGDKDLRNCLLGPAGPAGAVGRTGEPGPAGPRGPRGPRIAQLRKTVQKITKTYLSRLMAASTNTSTATEAPTVHSTKFVGFKVFLSSFDYPQGFFSSGLELNGFTDDVKQNLFNDGSHFNTTTGRFVVPENGTYRFDMIAHLTSDATAEQSLLGGITTAICPNNKCGLKGALSSMGWSDTPPFTQTASGVLRLTKGDYVSIKVFNLTFQRVVFNRLILSAYKIA